MLPPNTAFALLLDKPEQLIATALMLRTRQVRSMRLQGFTDDQIRESIRSRRLDDGGALENPLTTAAHEAFTDLALHLADVMSSLRPDMYHTPPNHPLT